MKLAKPIETWYKGQLYRSKLEACWAAFFDELGLRFEYELDAYELPSGNYLPDFLLVDVAGHTGVWTEIKATTPTERELELCRELCEGTGREVVILWGQPMTHVEALQAGGDDDLCVAMGWVPADDDGGVSGIVEHRGASPLGYWRPKMSHEQLYRAAWTAHKAVRWDPSLAAVYRADVDWRRRAR